MNADDDHILGLLLVHRRERGQIVAARPAPLGPEIEDDNLSVQVVLRQRLAIQPRRRDGEINNLLAQERGLAVLSRDVARARSLPSATIFAHSSGVKVSL